MKIVFTLFVMLFMQQANAKEMPIQIEDFSDDIQGLVWPIDSSFCEDAMEQLLTLTDEGVRNTKYCLEIKTKSTAPDKRDFDSPKALFLDKNQIKLIRKKEKNKSIKLTIEQIIKPQEDFNFDEHPDYFFNEIHGMFGCDGADYFVKNPNSGKYEYFKLEGCALRFNKKEKRIYDAYERHGDGYYKIYEIENLQPKLIYHEHFNSDPSEYSSCLEDSDTEKRKKCIKPNLKISTWDGSKMVENVKILADLPTYEIRVSKGDYLQSAIHYLKDKSEFTSARRVLFSFELADKKHTIYFIIDNLKLNYLNVYTSKSGADAVDFSFPENSKNKLDSEDYFRISTDNKSINFHNKNFKYEVYYNNKDKKVGVKVQTPQGSSELIGNFNSIKGEFNFLSIKGIENVKVTK